MSENAKSTQCGGTAAELCVHRLDRLTQRRADEKQAALCSLKARWRGRQWVGQKIHLRCLSTDSGVIEDTGVLGIL